PDLLRAGFFQQRLFKSTHVCLCRRDHPLVGESLTLSQFTRLAHAVVSPAWPSATFRICCGRASSSSACSKARMSACAAAITP
ncbi:hypothetical protein CQA09_28885, partial [Klebsiella pneumoniae]